LAKKRALAEFELQDAASVEFDGVEMGKSQVIEMFDLLTEHNHAEYYRIIHENELLTVFLTKEGSKASIPEHFGPIEDEGYREFIGEWLIPSLQTAVRESIEGEMILGKYSAAMGCVFLDEHAKEHPMVMGCYGIGITRTVAAVVEQNHDDDGIVWPWPIAPFHVHLVSLDPGKAEVAEAAASIETALEAAGFDILHDDREGVSPGVKFKDADLLGMPLRVTVGARGLKEGVVELRERRSKELIKLAPDALVEAATAARDRLA
jgi:threonyl-tRNA synthetase